MPGFRLLGAVLVGLMVAASPPAGAKTPKKRRAAHGKSRHWVHRKSPAAAPTARGAINEDVTITPFPSEASATRRALAQNRRDHLDDAERAARAPTQDDRWQTVLFALRDLDSRADPEGCFWRVVAYERLGEIGRARKIRDTCDLPPRDQAILEAEDAEAAALQPPVALAERDHPPPPVANPAPYTGAAPTRVDK
jgi:hypothetical protein